MSNRSRKDFELPDNLYRHLSQVREPVVISREGKENLVVMPERDFSEMQEQLTIEKVRSSLLEAEEDEKNGRFYDFEEDIPKLFAELGIKINA